MLNAKLKQRFQEDGYVMLEQAIDPNTLEALLAKLDQWVDDSRAECEPYGQTIDGRPRFDIQPETHSADNPALRRVASPIEIDDNFLAVARDNRALDLTAELFSPNIKLYASKINLKLPGSKTTVKYHQDFNFDPHTNMDMMTVLIFLDDVTLENGPLNVAPGSHKGELYSHWHDGVFTGAVSKEVEEETKERAVPCIGKAGDACLMHSCVLHGSASNLTDDPRRLFILTYVAEDAAPLVPNPIPHKYDGEIVRGKFTGNVRSEPFSLKLPEHPKTASFFGQQEAVTGA